MYFSVTSSALESSSRQKMTFNELPIEIIQMIFYIHVHQNIGSKRTLLRTCRIWYNVASNYAMLWRTIHWRSHSLSTMVHPDDQCLNLSDLAQHIERTGTLTFDLVLACSVPPPSKLDRRIFADTVDCDALSRCRSLGLYAPLRDDRKQAQDMVDTIITPLDGELPSLEHLSINQMGRGVWGEALDTLIGQVADSATKLQSLELSSRFWPFYSGERVFRYPNLMYRVQRLKLMSIGRVPWAEFPNLEHLDYALASNYVRDDVFNISELVAPRLTSLCLEGDFVDIELPPHTLFNQLTHMVLRDFSSDLISEDMAFPPTFSRLSSLGIRTTYTSDWLGHIKTETPLEELILVNDPVEVVNQDFSTTAFRPRVLRVDFMLDVPSHCGFGEPSSLWDHVEEVHVIVREEALWDWFVVALSKPARSQHNPQECYPLLRILTVLYPDNHQSSGYKQEQMEEVRDIQRWRHESGLRLLETLKIGWYHPCDHILKVPYAERRVTEWRDCLEDWTPRDE
jgi:F-box-like